MNYQIQGLSIHTEVHGSTEPALVFLHYWGGTSRTWRKVTAELEGQFKTVTKGGGWIDRFNFELRIRYAATNLEKLIALFSQENGFCLNIM